MYSNVKNTYQCKLDLKTKSEESAQHPLMLTLIVNYIQLISIAAQNALTYNWWRSDHSAPFNSKQVHCAIQHYCGFTEHLVIANYGYDDYSSATHFPSSLPLPDAGLSSWWSSQKLPVCWEPPLSLHRDCMATKDSGTSYTVYDITRWHGRCFWIRKCHICMYWAYVWGQHLTKGGEGGGTDLYSWLYIERFLCVIFTFYHAISIRIMHSYAIRG